MKKTKKQNEPTMKGSHLWGILIFFLLLLIDQAIKFIADAYFSANPGKIAVIPGWIELCQHYNKGVAFSGLDDAEPWVKILLIVGTGLMMAVLAFGYFKVDKRRTLLRIAIVFVVAGGVGNLIDRIYFRMWDPTAAFGVRDMVRVDLQIADFGVCNFADFFITAGAIMLLLAFLFFDKDAFFPVGKKYKALAAEAEAQAEAKKKAKAEKQKAQHEQFLREAQARREAEKPENAENGRENG